MRKIDLLRQLQDADSRIDSARTLIARLSSNLGNRQILDEKQAEAASAHQELRGLEAQQRDLELQADDRRAKISADEGKLYSGRVTNPKELASLADEVTQDKRQLSSVEDKLIDIMDRLEETSRRSSGLDGALAAATQAWSQEQDAARAKINESERAIATLEALRISTTSKLIASDVSAYETLRRQKNGLAVAQVHQRTCQACRVTLTPVLEQRARIGAELVLCHSCGRLLFVALS